MKKLKTNIAIRLTYMILVLGLGTSILNAQNLNSSTSKTFTYDANGVLITSLESQSFYDWRGRLLQLQSRLNSLGTIIASQPLYDRFGRAVIQTLPAPVGSSFGYVPNFVQSASDTPYDYTNFDIGANTNPGGQFNPDPVFSEELDDDKLGWYYSTHNDLETGVATTQFPYTRTLFHADGSNELALSTLPGNAHKLDASSANYTGRQAYTKTLPIGDHDLDEYINLRNEVISMQDLIESKAALLTNHIVGDKEIPTDISTYENQTFYIAPGGSLTLAVGFDTNGATFEAVTLSPSDYVTLREQGLHELSRDSNGKELHDFKDLSGNVIASAFTGTPNTSVDQLEGWTYNIYDDNQRLVASVSPNGVEQWRAGTPYAAIDKTTYEYNHRGWLLSMTETDVGKTEYMYRNDGAVRFSQNAKQLSDSQTPNGHKYTYTHYDEAGRVVEFGEFSGDFAFNSSDLKGILNNPGSEGMPTGTTTNWVKKYYDFEANTLIQSLTGLGGLYQQDFLMGGVSYSENEEMITWYSYNDEGSVDWMLQKPQNLNKVFAKKYTYDFSGNLIESAFIEYDVYNTNPINTFDHRYTYDLDQRLVKVETRLNGSPWETQAEYKYFRHGPLKRVELAEDLQGIDYRYTAQGWLKSINHPNKALDPGNDGSNNFHEDAFGMTLEYFDTDYSSDENSINPIILDNNNYPALYDGNIRATSWKTPMTINISSENAKAYAFNHDDRYQLTASSFGQVSSSNNFIGLGDQLKVTGLNYDANGNILGLQRYNNSAVLSNDFSYTYQDKTNKLADVSNHASYTYNVIGQMTKEAKISGTEQNLTYDALGKVTEVKDENGNLRVVFEYDDRGFRLKKTSYDNQTPSQPELETWYIRDANGALIATYDNQNVDGTFSQATSLKELAINGSQKLGTHFTVKNETLYELTDHLSNVRATIAKPKPAVNYYASFEDNLWTNNEDRFFELNTAGRVTDGSDKSAQVQAGNGNLIGPSTMLMVMPGDNIAVSLDARIESGTNNVTPPANILSSILGAMINDPVLGESMALSAQSNGNEFQIASLKSAPPSSAAYVNYLFYDHDFNFITGGYTLVTQGTSMDGISLNISGSVVDRPGFIYIYTSNESTVDALAYFDDIMIAHTRGIVRSAADYYSFGSQIDESSFSVINPKDYRFGYQGQYAEKDEETGWNSFELRMLDPVIARWLSPDPARQFANPYLAMANSPLSQIDPDGGTSWPWWWIVDTYVTLKYTDATLGEVIADQIPGLSGLRKMVESSTTRATNTINVNLDRERLYVPVANPETRHQASDEIRDYNETMMLSEFKAKVDFILGAGDMLSSISGPKLYTAKVPRPKIWFSQKAKRWYDPVGYAKVVTAQDKQKYAEWVLSQPADFSAEFKKIDLLERIKFIIERIDRVAQSTKNK